MAEKQSSKRKMMVNVNHATHEALREAAFTLRKSMSRIVDDAICDHLRRMSHAKKKKSVEA